MSVTTKKKVKLTNSFLNNYCNFITENICGLGMSLFDINFIHEKIDGPHKKPAR